MENRELKPGDVVQISPTLENCLFKGAFMYVTEPKSFGAQGFISVPGQRDSMPGCAYFRCKFEDMEYIGHAAWVMHDGDED